MGGRKEGRKEGRKGGREGGRGTSPELASWACDLCGCRSLLTHKGTVFGSDISNLKYLKTVFFKIMFCKLSLRDSGACTRTEALWAFSVSASFPCSSRLFKKCSQCPVSTKFPLAFLI